jgi:tRNA 5-methylaminomethyl-2-thiouridine biosynthesis bifunctional protein
MKVAIIGGGLAGTSCAYMLKQAGIEPVVYEAGEELAPAASGNALGLYNPRLSALRSAESEYYTAAFDLALEVFSSLCHLDRSGAEWRDLRSLGYARDDNNIKWSCCGALHLMTDETREKRFAQAVQNWGWAPEKMQIVDAAEASKIAGVDLQHGALYLPDSGVVSPKKLCAAYAKGVEIHFGTAVKPDEVEADAVIIACGAAAKDFGLPLNAVRGQLTFTKANAHTEALKTNLCYGGYFSPAVGGEHALGATFQRWLDHSQIIEEDDADNIVKLAAVAPDLAEGLEVTGHRAAVRAASKDHFPIVGKLRENLYVSAGHGSHGILSTLAAAEILTAMISGREQAFDQVVLDKLSPARFS